jgi:hypothetical protein
MYMIAAAMTSAQVRATLSGLRSRNSLSQRGQRGSSGSGTLMSPQVSQPAAPTTSRPVKAVRSSASLSQTASRSSAVPHPHRGAELRAGDKGPLAHVDLDQTARGGEKGVVCRFVTHLLWLRSNTTKWRVHSTALRRRLNRTDRHGTCPVPMHPGRPLDGTLAVALID